MSIIFNNLQIQNKLEKIRYFNGNRQIDSDVHMEKNI